MNFLSPIANRGGLLAKQGGKPELGLSLRIHFIHSGWKTAQN
jgi:hypothetical protein